MKEELTEKMHSEFTLNDETEILHRCITIWCYTGADSDDPNFGDVCKSYGVTTDQAMKNKEYCLKLKN